MQFVNSTISREAVKYDEGLRAFMIGVFNHMGLGLVVTAVVAYLCATQFASLLYVVNPANGVITGMNGLGMMMAFAPLVFIFLFSATMRSASVSVATGMFYLFATIMGASLSSIFIVYTGESIARTFLIAASMFGAMSIYGYATKKDLTSMGSFLFMGLIGVVIAGLVNMFFQSPGMSFAISLLGVVIFVGLTAYDVQKIKTIYSANAGVGQDAVAKMSIYGAFSLYMNFINLFLSLLRFFGNRRD